jgi:hypothetical protein
MAEEKALTLQLREASMAEVDEELRLVLRVTADEIDMWLRKVFVNPTSENMKWLNCAWIYGIRRLNQVKGSGGDGGRGGAMPDPEKGRIAA